MEQKEIKIEIPEGYEIDKEKSTFEKIVFKLKEKTLPKSWEELCKIKGYFIDSGSNIIPVSPAGCGHQHRNIFPTKEYAEATVALAQLLQLRKVYNDGWEPDWLDGCVKSVIYASKNEISSCFVCYSQRILSFKTPELAKEFMQNFMPLLEIAKPLI